MLPQSKRASFVEAIANTVIGFGINYAANLVLLPLFFHSSISLAANFFMGLLYTVISVVRGYIVRRWFNRGIINAIVDRVWK